MKKSESLIPIERIEQQIYVIRGERVMLDSDLASIYGVETRVFNQAIKRNLLRFPDDFMFQLALDEYESLIFQIGISNSDPMRSQNATSKSGQVMRSQNVTASKRNIRFLPYAFTEHGALMAANVLKSNQAVDASVQVVRAFVKMRNMLASNAELAKKIESMEKKYDARFKVVFDA
jgi:ORF6N domain